MMTFKYEIDVWPKISKYIEKIVVQSSSSIAKSLPTPESNV